jgi:hypothetical protein
MSKSKRNPQFLSFAEMEKLSTTRLLAYKESLYKVPEGPSHEETMYGGKDHGMHKQRPEWKAAVAAVKAVLAKREHVK